jgi:YHS domain-containing protein
MVFIAVALCAGLIVPMAEAQSSDSRATQQHQHPPQPSTDQTPDKVDQMPHGEHGAAPGEREGSGTAWLPDSSLMYAIHGQRGPWQLMIHGNTFAQYLTDRGDRGDGQFGSINWVMGMAHRDIGNGRLSLRGMLSAEPATIRGCGYPDLLATGELCDGHPIHDRQHQHDLFMEIAAIYERPLAGEVRWQVYGGPAAEPALGPVAYPHRLSAMSNLLAPITHHWLDSTHITFGVLTGGVYGKRWKTEASIFNGREPDEQRIDFDFAPLDSVSGRIWLMPTSSLAIQFSAGRLKEAEAGEDGGPRVDVSRATASATYHRLIGERGIWATTAAWGANTESDRTTNAFLIETNLAPDDRDAWYGRFEIAGKTAHDLDVPRSLVHDVDGDRTFTISKWQGGYTRYLAGWRRLQPGIGVTASAGVVPADLEAFYGRRVNPGFGVYLTVRPAVMSMAAMPVHSMDATHESPATAPMTHEHAAPAMVSPPRANERPVPADEPRLPVMPAERIIDPACADTIDLVNAPRASYQGKVYYFCSTADHDAFVKDPAAYLKKRGQQ